MTALHKQFFIYGFSLYNYQLNGCCPVLQPDVYVNYGNWLLPFAYCQSIMSSNITAPMVPEDGLRKLRQMENTTGIWTMRCVMVIDNKHVLIQDKGTGVSVSMNWSCTFGFVKFCTQWKLIKWNGWDIIHHLVPYVWMRCTQRSWFDNNFEFKTKSFIK